MWWVGILFHEDLGSNYREVTWAAGAWYLDHNGVSIKGPVHVLYSTHQHRVLPRPLTFLARISERGNHTVPQHNFPVERGEVRDL